MRTFIIICSSFVLLICGCKRNLESFVEPQAGVFLQVSASSDDTETIPRMVYTDTGYTGAFFKAGSIGVTWESGEIIEFCFRQDINGVITLGTSIAAAYPVAGRPKVSTFSVPVPSGIDISKTYDLYAVSGGNIAGGGQGAGRYIDITTNPSIPFVKLNMNTTLPKSSVSDNNLMKSIIQVARLQSVPPNTKSVGLQFRHIGALIAFGIKNTSSAAIDYNELKIYSSTNWLWDQNSKYNLVSGQMTGTPANTLLFVSGASYVFPFGDNITNSYKTYYQWFVPLDPKQPSKGLRIGFYQLSPDYYLKVNGVDEIGDRLIELGKRYYINRYLKYDLSASAHAISKTN